MSQWEGYCKHIAGLLIHWTKNRDKFKKLNSWDDALHNKTQEELATLIKNTAAESIDMTSILYQELFDETLLDEDEIFDADDW